MLDAMCARCITEGLGEPMRSPTGRARYGAQGKADTFVNGTALCAVHAADALAAPEPGSQPVEDTSPPAATPAVPATPLPPGKVK